jgi:hypothetical protein
MFYTYVIDNLYVFMGFKKLPFSFYLNLPAYLYQSSYIYVIFTSHFQNI